MLEAYSSLGGTDNKDLLENAEVKKIAQKLGKSPAQVRFNYAIKRLKSLVNTSDIDISYT